MRTRFLALRPCLVVAAFLFLHPLHSSAQSAANTIQPSAGLSAEAEYQVKALSWVPPVRFELGAPHEIRTPSLILAAVRSADRVVARSDRLADALEDGWLKRAVSREVASMNLSGTFSDSALLRVQQPGQQRRNWIGRHPVLFGTLVGFGAGFLIGYLPGDDGLFYDFTAEFNGLVFGGVGAGIGALVSAVATK
jgi:hypothetical protein